MKYGLVQGECIFTHIHMKAVEMEISHWGLGADFSPFICIQSRTCLSILLILLLEGKLVLMALNADKRSWSGQLKNQSCPEIKMPVDITQRVLVRV